jgi:hypothetical protein
VLSKHNLRLAELAARYADRKPTDLLPNSFERIASAVSGDHQGSGGFQGVPQRTPGEDSPDSSWFAVTIRPRRQTTKGDGLPHIQATGEAGRIRLRLQTRGRGRTGAAGSLVADELSEGVVPGGIALEGPADATALVLQFSR